ncbi:cytochrome P450 [Mangrovimonas spongiae]|uniref:Cytochrome P450 n=1 Tax=Mangrovimonas spongiae TaxID=2494697 RepID=A0A428K019_9FLAO|nr:cytochrome P450 [Mangrovimonas spongiae]RSK39780.1 cytochrome P450 [Mangrovimonas spongiae]
MNNQKQIPEVSTFTFLRHAINILNNPLPFHHKNFKRYGDTFKLNIGFGNYAIFSRDAALAEYVLQKNWKNYTKSPIQTKDLAKYLGNGLLTSEGEHWRKQRKLIQPAFHKKHLENLIATIKETIIEELHSIQTGIDMDVLPFFSDLAFKVVVKSLFSNAASDAEIKTLQEVTEENQNMLVKELRQPYLKWYFESFGIIKKHLSRTKESRNILQGIINRRKQSKIQYNDLLDMLLNARYEDGSSMDNDQLIDEILVLFVAGHETTANTLSFTVQLLAQHAKWQEKVALEYQTIIKNKDTDILTAVTQSQLAKQVIEESLRLYPPAYFIDRVNIQDDEFNGYQLKKGSSLLFSIYEIHRHKNLWDNPEDFNPNRFSPDQTKNYSSQYFPFGAGPRKCIGNNFAMYEMIITISELVVKYQIHPVNNSIDINPLITLKPKNAKVIFIDRV